MEPDDTDDTDDNANGIADDTDDTDDTDDANFDIANGSADDTDDLLGSDKYLFDPDPVGSDKYLFDPDPVGSSIVAASEHECAKGCWIGGHSDRRYLAGSFKNFISTGQIGVGTADRLALGSEKKNPDYNHGFNHEFENESSRLRGQSRPNNSSRNRGQRLYVEHRRAVKVR